MLLSSVVRLDRAAVRAAQDAMGRANTSLALPPSSTAMISNSTSNSTDPVAAPPRVTVSQPLTIVGRPVTYGFEEPAILDLGNEADLLAVRLAQGSRLILQRLVLAGLGPAGAGPAASLNPPALANFSAGLWAFSYARRNVNLRWVG